jgi:hypothetical protein
LREKGDIYLVDSTVTGSDTGTCRSPKYPMLPLFLDTVFPKVEALVGVGGRYAGYVPSSRVTMQVHTRRGTSTPLARPTVILGGGTGFPRHPKCPMQTSWT